MALHAREGVLQMDGNGTKELLSFSNIQLGEYFGCCHCPRRHRILVERIVVVGLQTTAKIINTIENFLFVSRCHFWLKLVEATSATTYVSWCTSVQVMHKDVFHFFFVLASLSHYFGSPIEDLSCFCWRFGVAWVPLITFSTKLNIFIWWFCRFFICLLQSLHWHL